MLSAVPYRTSKGKRKQLTEPRVETDGDGEVPIATHLLLVGKLKQHDWINTGRVHHELTGWRFASVQERGSTMQIEDHASTQRLCCDTQARGQPDTAQAFDHTRQALREGPIAEEVAGQMGGEGDEREVTALRMSEVVLHDLDFVRNLYQREKDRERHLAQHIVEHTPARRKRCKRNRACDKRREFPEQSFAHFTTSENSFDLRNNTWN